jgi:hypothetical protein
MLMTLMTGHLTSKTFTALAAFQAQDSIGSGNSKLLMLFIGVAAAALLIQAIVLAVFATGAMKAQKQLFGELSDFREKASQFIDRSNSLIVEFTPQARQIAIRVDKITTHIEKIAAIADQKAAEIAPTISAANQTVAAANQTAAEANLKARAQIARVNGMVTSALDATVRLGIAIERGIAVPGREVAGIAAGLKAGFDTLVRGARAFGSGTPNGRPRTYAPPQLPRPASPYRPEPTTPAYFRPTDPDLDL